MPHPQRKTGVAFFYLSPVFPKGGEAVRLLKNDKHTVYRKQIKANSVHLQFVAKTI